MELSFIRRRDPIRGANHFFEERFLTPKVIAASVLHLIRPPAFGPSSFGPWVALLAGVLAVVGILRARSRDRDVEPLARG